MENFLQAISNQDTEEVKRLGRDPDINKYCDDPFLIAAKNGDIPILNALRDLGFRMPRSEKGPDGIVNFQSLYSNPNFNCGSLHYNTVVNHWLIYQPFWKGDKNSDEILS